jgi:hypothetical protein
VALGRVLLFQLSREHGSIMRHGWVDVLDVLLNMFEAKLLPTSMTVVSGFVHDEFSLVPDDEAAKVDPANDSWFPFWGGAEPVAGATPEQLKLTAVARKAVSSCAVPELFAESAFLQEASLAEHVLPISLHLPLPEILPFSHFVCLSLFGSLHFSPSPWSFCPPTHAPPFLCCC